MKARKIKPRATEAAPGSGWNVQESSNVKLEELRWPITALPQAGLEVIVNIRGMAAVVAREGDGSRAFDLNVVEVPPRLIPVLIGRLRAALAALNGGG